MDDRETSLRLFMDFCVNSIAANDVDPAISYMNYIVDRMELNDEQVLWLCFLYGITYQLPTAWVLWNEFPDLELADSERLYKWFTPEVQRRLPYQIDKIKCRPKTVDTILSYQSIVGTSQNSYFDQLLESDNPQVNFDRMWSPLKSIYNFGRFSTWNHCQALKHVAGYNVEPLTLMLGESDSIAFTDGLAYAFGYPNKTTQKVVNKAGKTVKSYYHWSEAEKQSMESACSLLKNALAIDNFQLETLACAFKKIWRIKNSRYVGYYNDRAADDIRATERGNWTGIEWELLWDARQACVPPEYLHDNNGVNTELFKLPPEQKVYT